MAKIITLTGIDGSGKTTHAYLLAKALSSKFKCKVKVVYGGNTGLKIGRKYSFYLSLPIDIIIHRILKREHSYLYKNYPRLAKLETFLIYINYLLLVAFKVIFYSKLYDVLIMDRYIYDLIIPRVIINVHVKTLTRILYRIMPNPNLVILLDIDERVASARKPGEKSFSELRLLRRIYLHVAKTLGWEVVNTNRPFGLVFNDLWNRLLVYAKAKRM